jgi:predicted nucleic acid-binding protein
MLLDADLVCPAIWPTEVVNAVLMAYRRRRLNQDDLARVLRMVHALTPEIEPPAIVLCASTIWDAAQRHQLTLYDAAYLELAQRRRLPLATLDNALKRAAKKARVKLV